MSWTEVAGFATGALCVGYSHRTLPVLASKAANVCLVVPSNTRSLAVTNTPPLPCLGSSTCQATCCFTGS